MTEILAPVGSEESLVAVIQNGADAVYLSGTNFGARAFAQNFNEDQIVDAIQYAHIRGVKVYVTVNTLIKNSEWHDVKSYLDFLYEHDVDAVIVQDLGVADYVRRRYPDLELHGSTQMSASTLEDVAFLKSFGFDRVVVAREMSFEDIKEIKSAIDIEIEVFVHGALCVSYSGQCLMSSMIGGRSGNRGRCAQPCRQTYTTFDQTNYALSPGDLNVRDDILKLHDIGVDSLKIEGRMKGPEYGAVVVKSYREALDGLEETVDLNKVFHRTYTKGYLFGETVIKSDAPGNRGERIGLVRSYDEEQKKLTIDLEQPLNKGDEIQIRRSQTSIGARCDVFYQENRRVSSYDYQKGITVDFKHKAQKGEVIYRTYDTKVMNDARQSYHKETRKIDVEMVLLCTLDEVVLKITDGDHEIVCHSNTLPEKAIKVAMTHEKLIKQLKKLGSTAYTLKHVDVFLDEGLTLPLSVINDLRRQCTEALDQKRAKRYSRHSVLDNRCYELVEEPLCKLTVGVRNQEQFEAIKDLDLEIYSLSGDGISRVPRLSKHTENLQGPVLVGDYGGLKAYDQAYADYSLNVFNQNTINCYHDLGIKRVTLSYELSKEELACLKPNKGQELEYIIYGYVPVMIMSYCPVTKQTANCESCSEPCQNHRGLRDRFDEIYPVMRHGNKLEVLNHKRLSLIGSLDELIRMDILCLRLEFTIESPEEVKAITCAYLDALKGKQVKLNFSDAFTGHFYRGVE